MKKILAITLALLLVAGLAACGSGDSASVPAEDSWPNGKMTIYCPGNVGDPIDFNVRDWAEAYAEATGGEYEIVNDATGDGERLFQLLKEAKPDGMTLLIGGAGQVMQYYAGVHADNPADPECFTIVGPTTFQANMGAVLLTQPDAPYDDIEQLAEYVKAHPGEVTCAMSSGTSRFLSMTRLLQALDIYDDVRIIEANSAETTTGLLGGTINIALMNDQYLPQYLEDGSLKPLILTRIDRLYNTYIDEKYIPMMDEIPIFNDYGLEDYYTMNPMCVFGPAGMSPELCNKILDTMKILGNDDWAARVKETQGGSAVYVPYTHEEMTEIMSEINSLCAEILG